MFYAGGGSCRRADITRKSTPDQGRSGMSARTTLNRIKIQIDTGTHQTICSKLNGSARIKIDLIPRFLGNIILFNFFTRPRSRL